MQESLVIPLSFFNFLGRGAGLFSWQGRNHNIGTLNTQLFAQLVEVVVRAVYSGEELVIDLGQNLEHHYVFAKESTLTNLKLLNFDGR